MRSAGSHHEYGHQRQVQRQPRVILVSSNQDDSAGALEMAQRNPIAATRCHMAPSGAASTSKQHTRQPTRHNSAAIPKGEDRPCSCPRLSPSASRFRPGPHLQASSDRKKPGTSPAGPGPGPGPAGARSGRRRAGRPGKPEDGVRCSAAGVTAEGLKKRKRETACEPTDIGGGIHTKSCTRDKTQN
jgi:hypothetical protein